MEIEQELRIDNQRLTLMNQGYNFLNIEKAKGKQSFYINVFVETEQNLERKKEKIAVRENLPFSNCSCWNNSLTEFLKELDDYCKRLLVKIRESNNRKNMISLWGLSNRFRDRTLIFDEIQINITELAKQKLKEENIDLEDRIKKILKQQRVLNKQNQIKVDRYIYLKEKAETLKSFLKSDSYSWNKPKDNTLKILITPQEYNQKLKEIEEEMTKIAKEFNLSVDRFDYLTTREEIEAGYDEWLEESREDLKEGFEEFGEGQTFDEYVAEQFEVYCENRD